MSTTYGTIPTSVPGPDDGGGGGDPLAFLSRAKQRGREALATRRPWKELVHAHAFSLPHGLGDAYQRIRTNLSYFAMNYAIVVLVIVLASLLGHPWSLVVFFVMMVAWLALYFLRDQPLALAGRTVSDKAVLLVLSVVTIAALLFTGATWNIISSVLVGLVLVLVHAAIRRTDDLWSEEEGLGPRAPAAGAAGWFTVASSSS